MLKVPGTGCRDIEYERTDGKLGFIGIETKLTEPFSAKHVGKPTYRRWMTADAVWREDAAGQVDRVEHKQLWRDHLLAWAMLRHRSSTYAEGCLWVVHHPEDRRCAEVLEGYRRLLRDDSTLRASTLADVVAAWQRLVGPGSWLDDFRIRYLDLHRSEHLWTPPKSQASASAGPAVRKGHLRAVEQLEDTEAYNRTRALYRDALGDK